MKTECLERQDTSILRKERIDIHKQIFAKSEDRFIEQYVKEQSPDLLCESGCTSFFGIPPKYDQYDDDYKPQVQINLIEESETIFGKSKVQVQQPESSDQLLHFSYV